MAKLEERTDVHGLMESHRIKSARNYLEVGEVVLRVEKEKNRGECKKGLVL